MTLQEPHQRSVASTPTVRRATAGDLDEIVRIWEEGWTDAHTGHVPDGLLPFRQHAHFAALAAERVPATWVGVIDGVVAGFVVVKHDEIEQIYVDRRQRGTGIAALLLRTGEREIGTAGHTRAWLAVVAGNARARAFYARLGWRDGGPMTYQAQTTAGTFAVPTHRYERDLNASA
jgi:GNAT superfamily N-acetyltransferase